MASDLLALLDTLDGLHKAATPVADGGSDDNGGYLVPTDNDVREYLWLCPGGAATKDDIALLVALRLAYPRLAQALRTALTPTTDGEREAREAREALAKFDAPACGVGCDHYMPGHMMPQPSRCTRPAGHGGYHDADERTPPDAEHIRTALAILAVLRRERDEAREQNRAWADAWETMRDAVLNGRGPLEAVLDGDETNAVLSVIDDNLPVEPT